MEPNISIFGIVGDIIMGLAFNIGFLIFAWLVLLLLEYAWSGMAKFVKIILFPGTILHIASHYLFAKIFGQGTYLLLGTYITGEHTAAGLSFFSDIYKRKSREVYIILLSPMFTSAILGFLFQRVLFFSLLAGHRILAIILAWLTISIIVCGMPSLQDISFIATYHIIKHPEIIVALIWSIGVFSLGYIGYGLEIAIWGVLAYVMLILFVSFFRRESKYVVIS